MRTDDLWREFNAARAAMEPPDRAMLQGCGIALGDVVLLIGVTRARVSQGLYEPAEDGGEAFVTPILADDAIGPESLCPARAVRLGDMIDICAWHPQRHNVWALRTGSAEWAGSIPPQFMPPIPATPIRRSMLRWFQARCTGLVLLAADRPARHRVLTACRGGLVAEDARHLAELRDVLEHPWHHPPLTIARKGLRDAA